MKSAVKSLSLLSIFSITLIVSNAQLKLPVSNPIAGDIKKVIEDYPNKFNNLKGNLIISNPQASDYECNFQVKGAEETSITQYSSKNNDMNSWQTLLLTTESFEKARQKFKSLYGQLNQLAVKAGGARLKGKWEQPVETKNFTAIVFHLAGKEDFPEEKLRVELCMQYELLEWKVRIIVYDREREDDERGAIRE